MSAVSFLISMFGILSVMRMLRIFRDRALISTTLVTKTGTVTCATLILTVIFLSSHLILMIFTIGFLFIAIFLALWTRERREIDTLKMELPIFLDRWILQMRLGNSLSSARESALSNSSASLCALLEPLFISGAEFHSRHLILSENLLSEMQSYAKQPHNALVRLENTRRNIRKANAFRRKSGQAQRQTAIQSVVLLILQIALAVFTIARYGMARSIDLVIWSFLLSALGFIMMRKLSGKGKWKL